MTRTDTIGTHKTTVYSANGYTHVQYHNTCVVSFSVDYIVLRTGGWQTTTTKNRINQTAQQFGLDFRVYQEDYVWHVRIGPFTSDHTCRRELLFHCDGDGNTLTIDRATAEPIPQSMCDRAGYPSDSVNGLRIEGDKS